LKLESLLSQLPDQISKILLLHIFAGFFNYQALKLKEIFEVKDGIIRSLIV